jgi:hypothetical protein
VEDVVIFQKCPADQVMDSPMWIIGRVVEVVVSPLDGEVREVTLGYKNESETKFWTTHHAAQSVAVLHGQEDLDLMQKLNVAARELYRPYL